MHRRAVARALESAIPPAKRRPGSRPAPKLGEYRDLPSCAAGTSAVRSVSFENWVYDLVKMARGHGDIDFEDVPDENIGGGAIGWWSAAEHYLGAWGVLGETCESVGMVPPLVKVCAEYSISV